MATLPSEVPTGLLTGQYYFVNEDTLTDADANPQLLVVTGKVKITASVKVLRMRTKKAIVIPMVFDCKFNNDGTLIPDNGDGIGIRLPATDATEFDVQGWTYTARFDLTAVDTGYTVNLDPITFTVPKDGTVDLSEVIPSAPSAGVVTLRGPQGDQGETGPAPAVSVGTVEFTGNPLEESIVRQTVEADLDNPVSGITTALNAAIDGKVLAAADPRPLGYSWAFMGDSHTFGVGTALGTQFATVAPIISGDRFITKVNAGIGGQHSGQMVARFDADILGKGCDTLHLMAGPNDIGNAIPLATSVANIKTMVGKARAAGMAVILGTITPQTAAATTALKHRQTYAFNHWLKSYCAAENIPLVDYHRTLVDLTTGYIKADHVSGDGVHMNEQGHWAMAQALNAVIATLDQGKRLTYERVFTKADPTNLVVTPIIGEPGAPADSGGGSWWHDGSASATVKIVTGDANVLGNYYTVEMGALNTWAALYYSRDNTAWPITPGHRMLWTFKWAVDNLTQPSLADVKVWNYLFATDANYAVLQGVSQFSGNRPLAGARGALKEFTVPANVAHLDLRFRLETTATAGANARLKVGQVGLFDLTAMGLDGL